MASASPVGMVTVSPMTSLCPTRRPCRRLGSAHAVVPLRGRADRRSTRRSQDHNDLRPATTELRPPRRLRRRRFRCGSVTHGWRRALVCVSDAVRHADQVQHGTSLLRADLTDDELDAAPVLDSIDSLLIDELSEDEDDAFAAALKS
jgi:hypothetical protein